MLRRAQRLNFSTLAGTVYRELRQSLIDMDTLFQLEETVTVLEGIREKVGDGVTVEFAPGIRPAFRTFPSMFDMWPGNVPEDPEGFDEEAELQRAVELARSSDVAVIVAGEWQNMIGENASRAGMDLPGRQLELIQAVVETGTPTVLLVMNGQRVLG